MYASVGFNSNVAIGIEYKHLFIYASIKQSYFPYDVKSLSDDIYSQLDGDNVTVVKSSNYKVFLFGGGMGYKVTPIYDFTIAFSIPIQSTTVTIPGITTHYENRVIFNREEKNITYLYIGFVPSISYEINYHVSIFMEGYNTNHTANGNSGYILYTYNSTNISLGAKYVF